MASAIKLTYHKRLFMMLLAFTCTLLLSFIGFQYYREKQYKSEVLNAQLQVYNKQLIGTIENNLSYEDYIAAHEHPFEELRISIINVFLKSAPLRITNEFRFALIPWVKTHG